MHTLLQQDDKLEDARGEPVPWCYYSENGRVMKWQNPTCNGTVLGLRRGFVHIFRYGLHDGIPAVMQHCKIIYFAAKEMSRFNRHCVSIETYM